MTERWRKTISCLVVLLLALSIAWLPGCSKKDSDKKVMKIGHVLPGEHPTSHAMEFFKKRVEELSGGKIEVRLFPNSQLGSASELVTGCQSGNVEAAVVSAAPLAQFVPELNVLVMPFVFRDSEHRYSVLDGPVGQSVLENVNGVGLAGLTYFDAGTRNVMTKTGPVREPSDLAGQKIRVMDSNALRLAVDRLGASAVPMSQGEVYGALQTGVLDGWENNPSTCLNFSMQETGCKYFAWTRHVAIPDVLVIAGPWYEQLPDDLRKAIDQAAAETKDHQRKLWQETEEQAVAQLKKAGMEFNEVDTAAFASQFDGFYDDFISKYGESFGRLLQQIRNEGVDGGGA